MALDPRTIFLLDAAGAGLSVLLLGGVLPAIQPWIGMPHDVLAVLALWAVACLTYSLACYRFADPRAPRWLRGIMLANLGYCALTGALVWVHFEALTPLGVAYFIGEMPVLGGLVWYEFSVFRRAFSSPDAAARSNP